MLLPNFKTCTVLLLGAIQFVSAAEPAATNAAPPAKQAVDWAAIFKAHWQDRVKVFKEENLEWQHVVLLGDSITEGFDVAKYFPGRRVLNRGIGADVIGNDMPADDPRGVLQRLDASVFDCSPSVLFILIGINDLGMGRTVDQMETGYREMLRRLRARRPDLKVFLQSVLPTRGNYAKHNRSVLAFNDRLKKLASEYNCSYLDLHSLVRDGAGELKADFTRDGLHLTEPAYLIWRQEILKALGWD